MEGGQITIRSSISKLLLVCGVWLAGQVGFGAPYSIRNGGQSYIRAADAAAACGFAPMKRSGGLRFVRGKIPLALTEDKLPMYWGGVKIFQCFPAIVRKGTPYVSRLDFDKTLIPLALVRGRNPPPVRSVTIDCGHGGTDKGASGRFSREKDITLRVGLRVAEILRKCGKGYRVNLTRSKDLFLPLPQRCRIQRAARSDLFVSIHVNAAQDRSLSGIETFALTPAGAPSTSGGKAQTARFNGNRFDGENLFLAYSIQKALLRRTKAVDRGIKRARFAVLKDIDAPGVLIELGFISNPREERLLNDREYAEQLARAIAEGIISYDRGLRP